MIRSEKSIMKRNRPTNHTGKKRGLLLELSAAGKAKLEKGEGIQAEELGSLGGEKRNGKSNDQLGKRKERKNCMGKEARKATGKSEKKKIKGRKQLVRKRI